MAELPQQQHCCPAILAWHHLSSTDQNRPVQQTHRQRQAPEVDKQLFSWEGIHNLNSVDNANASHPLSVVRAQQQGQLDELIPAHPQLTLHILHPVLLHILLPLKDVPAQTWLGCCSSKAAALRNASFVMWELLGFWVLPGVVLDGEHTAWVCFA